MRLSGLRWWVAAMATIACVALVHQSAAAEEPSSVLQDILKIMRENGQITEEQKNELLRRAQQEAEQGKAEREQVEKERIGALQAGIENGRPFLQGGNGDFRVELGGRLHLDYAAVENNTRTLAGKSLADEFYVRRARIELSGTFFRWIDFRLECETSPIAHSEASCLNDGYLDLRFMPELALRVGQFVEPFGFEEVYSDRFMDFVERSIVNELEPERVPGASLHGSFLSGVVLYELGVFNAVNGGNGSGRNVAAANNGKEGLARITLAPFKTTGDYWLKGLQIQGYGTWGDEGLGTSDPGRTTARGNARFTYFGAQNTNGDRTRYGGDVQWAVGPVALRAEYLEQLNQRRRLGPGGTNLDEVDAAGWFVSAAWLVTGEDKPLNGPVVPRHPFWPVGGSTGWGAWELVARYAELSFDSKDPLNFIGCSSGSPCSTGTGAVAVGPAKTGGAEALTFGVNWYLNRWLRYMVNWTNYWYDNPYATPLSCRSSGGCSKASQFRKVEDPTSWELLTRVSFWF